MKKLSFNIIGAGAMGHLWASFLLKNGFNVNFYSRTPQAEKCFQIKSPYAHFTQDIQYKTISQWTDADVILVCVKAHQLEKLCLELCHDFKQKKNQPCPLILMMNGMGLVEIIQKCLPQHKCLQASIVHGVHIKDNIIHHLGEGKTLIGNFKSDFSQQEFDEMIKQLNDVLPTVEWNKSHQHALYLKLVINAIINPLTVLANETNACLLANGKLNLTACSLLDELEPLLEIIIPDLTQAQIKSKIESVAYSTKDNISSMLQDVRAGKETEIEFINGYLVKLAESYSINLIQQKKIIAQIKTATHN